MKVGDDEVLTLAEASARIGLTTADLRAQAGKGRLHATHMGKFWVVLASELDRYDREVKGKRGRKPARPRADRGATPSTDAPANETRGQNEIDAPGRDESMMVEMRHAAYQARYWRERRKPRIAADAGRQRSGRRPSRTKYQPLLDFLAASPDAALTLTFAEIEEIIGAALPSPSAIRMALGPHEYTLSSRLLRALGWRARLEMGARAAHLTRGTS